MERKVDALLKEAGAVLIRSHKHEVWKLPNGKQFVRAKTTSDRNSHHNNISDLRKLLGLTDERGKEGVRREKQLAPGREKPIHYTKSVNTSLADKLRVVGVAESSLRERIQLLERQNELLQEEVNEVCWFCRLRDKFNFWRGKNK